MALPFCFSRPHDYRLNCRIEHKGRCATISEVAERSGTPLIFFLDAFCHFCLSSLLATPEKEKGDRPPFPHTFPFLGFPFVLTVRGDRDNVVPFIPFL